MGYDIEQTDGRFRIEAGRVAEAYRLACTLRSPDALADGGGGSFAGGVQTAQWYKFVNPGRLEDADDLVRFLEAFRYDASSDDAGAITGLRFTGQKLGQCHVLFEAIAPCVTPDSYLEFTAEDDARWRYEFDGTGVRVNVLQASEWGPEWLQTTTPTEPSWRAGRVGPAPDDETPTESWLPPPPDLGSP